MPNHIHFIVQMLDTAYAVVQSQVGAAYYAAQEEAAELSATEASFEYKSKMLLPKIIQQFKSTTVKGYKNTVLGLHSMQP